MLSVIIPTLNAASHLATLLPHIVGTSNASSENLTHTPIEILVVDGGSLDATARIAEAHGAKVIQSQRGRGTQLDTGTKAAKGKWLFFLHADSNLDADWQTHIEHFIADKNNLYRAAYFRFQLDEERDEAKRVARLANWRAERLGLPYGDQGLVISRAYYDRLGGYPNIPLMEDVAMVRKISRSRLQCLPGAITTSADRYRRDGYWQRPIRNVTCLILYFLGLPPDIIKRLYG